MFQIDSMSDDLRVSLWNAVSLYFWRKREIRTAAGDGNPDLFVDQPLRRVVSALWIHHLKWPLDEFPETWSETKARIREHFFAALWHEVYDFIEYISPEADRLRDSSAARFMGYCNGVLSRENSAYRFVSGRLAPITNDAEISEIERALQSPSEAVRMHVQAALMMMADKESPDLDGAVLAALQSVEAVVRMIDDHSDADDDFVAAMNRVKDRIGLTGALDDGFLKLCGLTYNQSGFSHTLKDDAALSPDDARFILVSCSAFANYLLTLAQQAKVL